MGEGGGSYIYMKDAGVYKGPFMGPKGYRATIYHMTKNELIKPIFLSFSCTYTKNTSENYKGGGGLNLQVFTGILT